MKPVHFAALAAVVAAGLLVWYLAGSDARDPGRSSRAERATERGGAAARERDADAGAGRKEAARAGDGNLTLTLRVVTSSGAAAQGARVTLSGRDDVEAGAGADGRVAFEGLQPGFYALVAIKGRATAARTIALERVTDLGTLKLAAGVSIRGRVLNPTGAPIPGASVRAVVESGEGRRMDIMQKIMAMVSPDTLVSAATSDPSGAYELFVPARSRIALRATAAGYGLETISSRPFVTDTADLDFHLFPSSRLTGRVVDPRGAAIAGAHVLTVDFEALMTGGSGKAEAITAADGSFSLPLLSRGLELALVARAPGYSTYIGQDLEPRAGGITITLERGVTLRLRAVDGNGRPAPGVTAFVVYKSSFASGVTEADGRLEIPNISTAPGTLGDSTQIYFHGGRYVPMQHDIGGVQPVDGTLDIGDVELSLGGIVRGRVLDALTRKPIEGADVRVMSTQMNLGLPGGDPSVSDADGRYELYGVPLSDVVVVAVHPDYTVIDLGEAQKNLFDLSAAGPPEAEHDILLTPGIDLNGTVVGPDNEPVAGAQVVAMDEEMLTAVFMGLTPPPPISDAAGRFVYRGLAKGVELQLLATHRDYGPSSPLEVTVGEKDGVMLRLGRPIVLSGKVVDGQTRPVRGVAVEVSRLGNQQDTHAYPVDIAAPRPTVTDDEGRYVLRNVPPGRWKVSFDHPGYRPAELDVAIPPDAKVKALQNMILRPGLALSGIAVDGTGKPLADIGVSIDTQTKSPDARTSGSVVTGRDGRFSFGGLADGVYKVSGSGSGWYPAEQQARAGSSDVRLVMSRPGRLEGRVTSGGAPVRGATVSAVTVKPQTAVALPDGVEGKPGEIEELEEKMRFDYLDSATTDGEGRFVLDSLPPDGIFALRVSHVAFRSRHIENVTASERPRHITLDPGVRIAGTVVDPANRPVEGAQVGVTVGRRAKSVRTNKNGRFEVGGLAEGEIKVHVGESGLGLLATEPVAVEPGDTQVRLTVQRGETIAGTVVQSADGKQRWITIHAVDDAGEGVKSDWIWLRGTGRFAIKGLPPGTYALRVVGNEGETLLEVPGIVAGTEDVRITLP